MQFVQVGGDEDAAEYLRELDDDSQRQFSRVSRHSAISRFPQGVIN